MNTPLIDSFVNENLTDNFTLKELLFSDFYSPSNQEKVLVSYYADPSLKQAACALAEHLQVIRNYLGCPLSVNIAYRPKWWELKQGRSGGSKHTKFEAADVVSDNHAPKEVEEAINFLIKEKKVVKGGLHAYSWGTHTDIRGFNARW